MPDLASVRPRSGSLTEAVLAVPSRQTTPRVGLVAKRLFDLAITSVGLIVLSPALVFIALLIKLEDGGPVFYRGVRVGRRGKAFRIHKFRTMVVNAEKIGGPSTADDDPRITRVGRYLRKYKLDELPELIDVFIGEMSLVGPRPEVKSEVDLYTEEERFLLTVRPGITDFSSIEFHDEGEILKGSEDAHEAYRRLIRPRKIQLGLEYARNRSFPVDMHILWQTLKTLLNSRLAHRQT